MHLLWIWLQFAGLALVIGFVGYRLSVAADQISIRTGLVVISLIQPPQRRVLNTASALSLLLLGLYALNAYVVFSLAGA